jgi:hypothetical protein
MAKVFANAGGTILRFLRNADEERRFPAPPPGTTTTLTFDEEVNAAVVAALDADWNAHQVVGGQLRRNGVPVPLAADGPAALDRTALPALLPKLSDASVLTATELKTLLRLILRLLKQL